jgi:ankyrin repeat protein
LLPALQIQSVLEATTPRDRQDALNTIPEGLQDAFEVTIKRINHQKSKSKHAMKILQWIFLAVRPLSIDELRHALATHPNDTEYDNQRALTTSQIIDFCLGLVILDKETSIVRLVHKSLQDYLCSEYDNGGLFKNGHEEIAISCLTYMNFNYSSIDGCRDGSILSAMDSSTEPGPENTADRLFDLGKATLKKYAFLDYAICNWSHHVNGASNPKAERLGIKFLSGHGGLQCISRNLRTWPILIAEHQLYTSVWPIKHLFDLDEGEMKDALVNNSSLSISGLHIASIYGVEKIVQNLIDNHSSDINAQFRPGASPLLLATIGNHKSITNLLLKTPNIKIDLECEHGAKLLFVAAYNGNLDTVRQLIQRTVTNGKLPVNIGSPAFLHAIQGGNTKVIHLILERCHVNFNYKGTRGNTALIYATQSSARDDIVRLLLSYDQSIIDVNLPNDHGSTGLLESAGYGSAEVVRLLLERTEIDVNIQNKHGFSALILATIKGHLEVVRLLLKPSRKDVDLNLRDEGGFTALLWASAKNYHDIVSLLLGEDTIGVNLTDKGGITALTLAAFNGHTDVVRLLLERAEADVNMADENGDTALTVAASLGHTDTVKLLLERAEADVNMADENGDTALTLAALKGHTDVVRLLLERAEADVNLATKSGRTALTVAASLGHTDVVRLLLERAEADVNMAGEDGHTALTVAAYLGHTDTVKLLLERAEADVNLATKSGRTALTVAACNGHTDVVRLLLERAEADVNMADKDGDTALTLAACNGHTDVVRLLLERAEVDVNMAGKDGDTALTIAVIFSHIDIVRLLLSRVDVDINRKNNKGLTAIKFAARNGNQQILRLLLDRSELDINVQDNDGDTALACAALNGHTETVQMLLRQVGIDVNFKNNDGKTVLSIASNKGYDDIVRILREDGRIQETCEEGATPSSVQTSEAVPEQPEILCNATPHEPMPKEISHLSYPTDDNTETPPRTILKDAQEEDELSSNTTPTVFTTEISHLSSPAEEETKKTTMQDTGTMPGQPNSFSNSTTDTLIAEVKTSDMSSPTSSISQAPQPYASATCEESPTELLQRPNSVEVAVTPPSVQVSEAIEEEPRPSSHRTSASLTVNTPYLPPSGAESSLSVDSGVSASKGSVRRAVRGSLSKVKNRLKFW